MYDFFVTAFLFLDADNVLKQRVSSSHSLSTNNDRQLLEVKEEAELARPRGMSSIYHDSDENMVGCSFDCSLHLHLMGKWETLIIVK